MYKVLIVEDEDIIRKGLLFMVNWQEADCVVVGEAVDGLEGLEKNQGNKSGYCGGGHQHACKGRSFHAGGQHRGVRL